MNMLDMISVMIKKGYEKLINKLVKHSGWQPESAGDMINSIKNGMKHIENK